MNCSVSRFALSIDNIFFFDGNVGNDMKLRFVALVLVLPLTAVAAEKDSIDFENPLSYPLLVKVYPYRGARCENSPVDQDIIEKGGGWRFDCARHGLSGICYTTTDLRDRRESHITKIGCGYLGRTNKKRLP